MLHHHHHQYDKGQKMENCVHKKKKIFRHIAMSSAIYNYTFYYLRIAHHIVYGARLHHLVSALLKKYRVYRK